jgi:hypothetical protein
MMLLFKSLQILIISFWQSIRLMPLESIEKQMQLELFEWAFLSPSERGLIHGRIRNSYTQVRLLRGGRFGQAALRRHYRKIEVEKKRLELAGVGRREILDFLQCCRLKCSGKKPPFKPCKFCL